MSSIAFMADNLPLLTTARDNEARNKHFARYMAAQIPGALRCGPDAYERLPATGPGMGIRQ